MIRAVLAALALSLTVVTPSLRAADAPLSLVLLVDVTRSVGAAMAQFIWDGGAVDGRGGLGDPRPSGVQPADAPDALFLRPVLRGVVSGVTPVDRVRIGRIAGTTTFAGPFTTDLDTLRQAARWLVDVPADARHGASPLWDAVVAAVTSLEEEQGRRRVVLLVTDGLSTGNSLGLDAAIARARRADVSVSVIGEAWKLRSGRGWVLGDRTDAAWMLMSSAFGTPPLVGLERLAGATGGVFVLDGDRGQPDLERRLREAMLAIRSALPLARDRLRQ